MIFINKTKVLEIHAIAIQEHGGDPGILNEGALESAIIAIENRDYYEGVDIVALAATYAYHLTQAHAFVDGNKRTAAGVMLTFLLINDAEITATEDQLYDLFISIASGDMTREQAEEHLRKWITC